MTSFATSKAFSKSVDATSAHDATLAGGASLNRGIILTAAVVDRAFKGSMAREEMKKALEEKWERRGELRDFKGREPLLLLGILPFHAYERWVLNG
jgi:hypothetical protein